MIKLREEKKVCRKSRHTTEPKAGKGIREQMEASNQIHYEYFGIEEIEKVLNMEIKDPSKGARITHK